MSKKHLYRISFIQNGNVYEVYARQVAQSDLYGFVEIEGLKFGENTSVVVDPSEERLKDEFAGVQRFMIPMHAVIRIDEVSKQGTAKISEVGGSGTSSKVTPFPIYTPGDKS